MSNATVVLGLRYIHACFIPHPVNNHHPFVLRHKSLASLSILLITAKILAFGIIALTPSEAVLSTITTNRIIQLTNEERIRRNLPALQTSVLLTQSALAKANDMMKNQYFAHISPSGVTPWYWMQQVGYSYEVAGENLAIDFTSAEDVNTAWLASPTHKENMLRPDYTETGVAVLSGNFKGSTSIIVVHMFGKSVHTEPKQVSTPIVNQAQAKTVPIHATPLPLPSPTPSPLPIAQLDIAPVTTGPILLSPAFDQEQISLSHQLFSARSAIASNADVISAIPMFTIQPPQPQTFFAHHISQLDRRLAGSIAITISILLFLAIIIRAKTQHPLMIGHAGLVIVLAIVLLVVDF